MPTIKYRFYYDMDNTLVDFNAGLPQWALNTNRPTEKLDTVAKETKRKMWSAIEQNTKFWHELRIMPDVIPLLYLTANLGENFILSKAPGAKNFVGGDTYVDFIESEKRQWILRNLGQFFDDQHITVCRTVKTDVFSPTKSDILIDDRFDNIVDWVNAGGAGILFDNAKTVQNKIKLLYGNCKQ